MDLGHIKTAFFESIVDDPHIGPAHISLFMSIFYYCEQRDQSYVHMFSRDLKKLAKISSAGTYSKCMNELKKYGYIDYEPSYDPDKGSFVALKIS